MYRCSAFGLCEKKKQKKVYEHIFKQKRNGLITKSQLGLVMHSICSSLRTKELKFVCSLRESKAPDLFQNYYYPIVGKCAHHLPVLKCLSTRSSSRPGTLQQLYRDLNCSIDHGSLPPFPLSHTSSSLKTQKSLRLKRQHQLQHQTRS